MGHLEWITLPPAKRTIWNELATALRALSKPGDCNGAFQLQQSVKEEIE
jgi:hypothetical protein